MKFEIDDGLAKELIELENKVSLKEHGADITDIIAFALQQYKENLKETLSKNK